MNRILRLGVSALAALALAIPAFAQAPGDLDFTFGGGTGMVHLGFGFAHDTAYGVAVQGDGKIVLAGNCDNGERSEVALARYNTDGTLDPTFDGDGIVITSVTPSTDPSSLADDLGFAMALQPDGKILVAGISRVKLGENDFLVVRYETDGSLDVNFGINGSVITDVTTFDDEVHAIAIQPDGKIVVAGFSNVVGGGFSIVRYDENGTPDPTFSGGIVSEGNQLVDNPYGVAIQSDGKILVTGYSVDMGGNTSVSLLRLNSDGTPDLSFDGDGWVYSNLSPGTDVGYAVALQADPPFADKILVAGGANTSQMAVLRFTPTGAPDLSFDTDGVAYVPDSPIGARDIAVVESGGVPSHIVVCGSIMVAGQARFGAARFLVTGAPDATFNDDGVVTTQIGTSAGAASLELASGKILVAGSGGAPTDADFALARYNDDGTLDGTLDGDGVRTDPLGNSVANGRAVAHQPDDKIVIAGNVTVSTQQRIGVMRLLSNGLLDLSFGGRGTVTTDIGPGNDLTGGVIVQPDGKIVVAGTSLSANGLTSNIAVVRYLANGDLDAGFLGGVALYDIQAWDRGQAIALQADGKLVIAGWTSDYSDYDFVLLRLNSDGTPDGTFGIGGFVRINLSLNGDLAHAVAIGPGGKIVAAGEYINGSGLVDVGVLRLHANGTPDGTFDGDGFRSFSMGLDSDGATSVAIQSDGKIVIGGWALDAGLVSRYAILRLDDAGAPDPTFDEDGLLVDSFGIDASRANGVALQSDGRILIAGPGSDDEFREDYGIARFLTGGSPDSDFTPSGSTLYDIVLASQDNPSSLSLDSSGRIVVAGTASGVFGVLRLLGMQSPIDVPIAGGHRGPRLELVGANPFTAGAVVSFELVEAGPIALEVFDVTGGRVRTLATGTWGAGPHRVEWDGTDAAGREAPAGVYFLRLAHGRQQILAAKAIKIR